MIKFRIKDDISSERFRNLISDLYSHDYSVEGVFYFRSAYISVEMVVTVKLDDVVKLHARLEPHKINYTVQ